MLVGTIDFYHSIPLSLTLTFPGGNRSAQSKPLFSLFHLLTFSLFFFLSFFVLFLFSKFLSFFSLCFFPSGFRFFFVCVFFVFCWGFFGGEGLSCVSFFFSFLNLSLLFFSRDERSSSPSMKNTHSFSP